MSTREVFDAAPKQRQTHGNFDKSGIMLWSYDAALRSSFADTTFETAEGTFPKVTSYKYLGIEVTEDLPMFMGGDALDLLQGRSTDALRYAKSLAAKGLAALSTLKPVLCDPACPIPLKSELIKAFVMSVMAYGSEFIGFNKKLAQPAQRVLDLAARWCVGLKKSNKMTSGMVLSVELGLPLAYEVYAGQRARLYHKLKFGDPPMETLLVDLQKEHSFHPQRTWCSENEFWLKRFHAPRNSSRDWRHGESGINKYVPYEIEATAEARDSYWEVVNPRTPNVRTFYREGFDWMKEHVTQWYLAGGYGDTNWGSEEETRRCWKIKAPENPSPIRGWYSFARMVELHRRSNPYRSKALTRYRQMVLGVDENGRVAIDPRILSDGMLTVLLNAMKSTDTVAEVRDAERKFRSDKLTWKPGDLVVERHQQEAVFGSKKSDDGARRIFVREVRECALERLFSVDGMQLTSFTGWYDKFQFGATRDFLRISLGRPDLAQGVRWLVLCRTGAFPRVYNARTKSGAITLRQTCPLCGGNVEVGWDWIHLALDCAHAEVQRSRYAYIRAPMKYLLSDKVTRTLYDMSPSVPESVEGLPYGSLKSGQQPGLVRFAVAVRLVGGCIHDPRESAYLMSFGHTDFLLTKLAHFGYVFMASFLQDVAPLYCRAMGVNNPRIVDLDSTSSRVGTGGVTPLGAHTENSEDEVGALRSPSHSSLSSLRA